MREENGLCRASLGSATNATRAEGILARAAIRSRVIKISSEQKLGCMYGLEFSCSQKTNVEGILRSVGIPFRLL